MPHSSFSATDVQSQGWCPCSSPPHREERVGAGAAHHRLAEPRGSIATGLFKGSLCGVGTRLPRPSAPVPPPGLPSATSTQGPWPLARPRVTGDRDTRAAAKSPAPAAQPGLSRGSPSAAAAKPPSSGQGGRVSHGCHRQERAAGSQRPPCPRPAGLTCSPTPPSFPAF